MFLTFAALMLGMQTAPAPLMVRVEGRGSQCRTLIDGTLLDGALIDRARAEVRDGREALVSSDAKTPYRCVGGAIFALQQAGFTRIDFVTDIVAENAR